MTHYERILIIIFVGVALVGGSFATLFLLDHRARIAQLEKEIQEAREPAKSNREASDAKEDSSRIMAKVLSQACETYALKHNDAFPDSLEMLLQPDPANGNQPYLKSRDALLDPWGVPFQYDRTGKRNNGLRPDIYCKAPDGKIIGNWLR
jgi:hypothetical protein